MAAYRGTRGVDAPKPKKEKVSKATDSDFIDISSKSTKAVHKKRNTVIQIVSIVMAVLFIVSGGALVYASSIMNSLGDEDGTLEKNTKNYTVKDDRGNGVISDNKLLANKDVLNVMLFGQDSKESKDDNGRSDSMILVSIDVVHKQIKMTSFLRDTYVYIPSGDSNEGWNKLNASYSFGGAKLAVKTIESNFGIKVDRYGIVDFSGFKEVINALGGVTLPITGVEARYINAQIDYNHQKCKKIPEKYCKSVYKKDKNGDYIYDKSGNKVEKTRNYKLNGQQALWYARNRGSDEISTTEVFPGSDWDRTERQRKLINAVVKKFKNASFTELLAVVNEIGPMIQTNFKQNDITSLMSSALTLLKYPMYQFHIPIGEESDPNKLWTYDNPVINGYESSVVKITDWDKTRSQLANFVFNKASKKYLSSGSSSSSKAKTSSKSSSN